MGDSLGHEPKVWDYRSDQVIPDWAFAIAWALGLIATGVWAVWRNKRWVVNLVAIFGAIHFYTQYFERLGAEPAAILIAGLLALGFAMAFVRYNRSFKAAMIN